LTLGAKRVKAAPNRNDFMRGLLMAFFALDFPGHGVMPAGGRAHAFFASTKTTAKKTTATTV
jgi:hypothetical protein